MRPALAAVVGGVLLAAGATAGIAVGRHRSSGATAAPSIQTATAQVVRTDVVSTQEVTGQLSYGPSTEIVGQTGGTAVTALPRPGQVIDRGGTVYEVDGLAVALFLGDRPAWRTLGPGVHDGPDVRQLEANLVALGYATSTLKVDNHVDANTARAVRAWQRSTGRLATGRLAPGEVVWAASPLRVATVDSALGSRPQPGAVLLHATRTAHVVDVQLPVAQQGALATGNPITVRLPDGTELPGHVDAIDATVQASDSTAEPGRFQSPTIDVHLTLDDPSAGGSFAIAPVTVDVVAASAHDVLAVPVNALVAPADGGFAVEVVRADGHHQLVPVTTGVYSRTLVEVSGEQLRAGDELVVPAP